MKYEVMQKTNILFNGLGQKLSQSQLFPAFTDIQHYKISKGENLMQMPYMVLDYPQIKEQNIKLVLRTLFWWGHFMGCQLIIQKDLINVEATATNLASKRQTRIWTGSDLWNHDCKSDEFTKLKQLSATKIQQVLARQSHLKLASAHRLKTFNSFDIVAFEQYREWANLVVWK